MVLATHERDKQISKQSAMETRLICWYIYKSNADPKTAVKTIGEFMPLDGEAKPKALSQKALQKAAKALEERLNKRKDG